MIVREFTTAIAIIFVVSLAIIGVSSRWFTDGPDNATEERCEEIIFDVTGVPVDLSPDTPDPQGG